VNKRERRILKQDERIRLWLRQGGVCCYCGIPTIPIYYQQANMLVKVLNYKTRWIDISEFDHWVAFAKDGKNDDSNLFNSCKKCNRSKGSSSVGWKKPKTSILGKILYTIFPAIEDQVEKELNSRKEK